MSLILHLWMRIANEGVLNAWSSIWNNQWRNLRWNTNSNSGLGTISVDSVWTHPLYSEELALLWKIVQERIRLGQLAFSRVACDLETRGNELVQKLLRTQLLLLWLLFLCRLSCLTRLLFNWLFDWRRRLFWLFNRWWLLFDFLLNRVWLGFSFWLFLRYLSFAFLFLLVSR